MPANCLWLIRFPPTNCEMQSNKHKLFVFAEGEGERAALRILIRRILYESQVYNWEVPTPYILKGNPIKKFLKEPDKYINYSLRTNADAILFVADLEDGCPVILANDIKQRFPSSIKIEVAFAIKEFEAWFLAAGESLFQRQCPDPERYRDAKKHVKLCAKQPNYREVIDMPKFAELMDLKEAEEKSRSFRHFANAIRRLVTQ